MLALIYALHVTITPQIDHSITDSMRNRLFTEAVALQHIGADTSHFAGTNHGRLACVAAVNDIIQEATGSPVDASLDTPVLDADLARTAVAVSIEDAAPGDLIISPSSGHRHGHVGIISDGGAVLSNNSPDATFRRNYNVAGWVRAFRAAGLSTHVFRLR